MTWEFFNNLPSHRLTTLLIGGVISLWWFIRKFRACCIIVFESNRWILWLRELDGSILPHHAVKFVTFYPKFIFLLRHTSTSFRFFKFSPHFRSKLSILRQPAGFSAPPQFQNVVRSAYQRPLAAACVEATAHKTPESASILNLAKHRLYRLAS